MNDGSAAAPARRRAAVGWLLLFALLAGFGGWRLWQGWRARAAGERTAATQSELRIGAIEARIDALRRDQRAQGQRLQQADATNRVLRDELLGIGQRAALVEDSIGKLAKLAASDRRGVQALRLDEAELLLTQGQQRLSVSGDLDGARRAYALAAGVLDGVDDPAYLSLRQTLAQERAALDALGMDPKASALAGLEAFSATLPAVPAQAVADPPAARRWWQRALARIVAVRPADRNAVVDADARAAGAVALQLELTLARAAIERRDAAGYRGALARVDAWLLRLWPPSKQLRELRVRLQALDSAPLALALPTLGTTLAQLRALRASA